MEKIPYRSLNNYLHEKFGCKVYKIALNGGFSCPNRDGTKGTGGCIFCSAGGSGDFAADSLCTITKQLEEGKKFISGKLPKGEKVLYIAYFQAFTNTYAPVSELRRKYMEAVNDPEVAVISIATRPDCLQKDVLDLLSEINEIKPVWVELGLQTIHEASAAYIRRGYDLSVYDCAVRALAKRGIYTITHVIIGLPGESKDMILETVKYVCDSKVLGIKLQLLHVLKGTDLEKDYEARKFETLSFEEYEDIICDCLKLIPPDITVHRLTGDGDKKILVAPLWSGDKKHVLNEFAKRITPV